MNPSEGRRSSGDATYDVYRVLHSIRMFRSQLHQYSDRIPPTVLHECSWNDLHRVRDGSKWPSLDTRHTSCFCVESNANGHFGRTTAGCKDGVEVNITGNREGVGKVTVNFVQDIFRGPRRRIVHALGFVQPVRRVEYLE